MKTITVLHGIVAALGIVCMSLAAGFVLHLLLPWRTGLQAEIAMVALLYLGYLFYYSGMRAGKIVLGAASLLVLIGAAGYLATPVSTIAAAVGLIWIIRTLLYAGGLLAALADLGLCLLGTAFAAYVYLGGHGFISALWGFFLTQALWALVPKRAEKPSAQATQDAAASRFNRAYATANAVLKKLANNAGEV